MEANVSRPPNDGRRDGEGGRRSAPRDTNRRSVASRRTQGFARGIIGALLALKLYRAAEVIKFLKALKILEPVAMLFSGILTAGTYSLTMKASLATGLIVSLTVHELGHFWATKRLGLEPRWWLFIPFVGALMPSPEFRTRGEEAAVAYGGPLVGAAFSAVLYVLWLTLPLEKEWANVLFATSLVSTALNLFNLIPLSPIDGGRITQAVHPLFRWAGFGLLIALSLYFGEASILLVWMLVVGDIRMHGRWRLALAGAFWLAMPVMILMGYHGKYPLEDWCYFAVGAWLLYVYYSWYTKPSRVTHDHRNVPLTSGERRRWGWRYLTLLAFLGVLMGAHVYRFSGLTL